MQHCVCWNVFIIVKDHCTLRRSFALVTLLLSNVGRQGACWSLIFFYYPQSSGFNIFSSKQDRYLNQLTSWLWETNGKYFLGVNNIMRPHFEGVARINTASRPSWETVFNIFLETYMKPVAYTLIFNLYIFQVLTPQYLFLVPKESCLRLCLLKGFGLHFKLCAWVAWGWVCAHTCWYRRKPKGLDWASLSYRLFWARWHNRFSFSTKKQYMLFTFKLSSSHTVIHLGNALNGLIDAR